MTMHLERGISTLNTRKRKRHITKAKMVRWEKQLHAYNKNMKRLGLKDRQKTMDQYIEYIHGYPNRKTETVTSKPYQQPNNIHQRTTDNIPSYKLERSFAPAIKKEPLQYTGERILLGVATMHKSNMVPIFANDEEDKNGRSKAATEIARMRR